MTENLSTNSVFDRHYQDVDDRGNFVAVLYYFAIPSIPILYHNCGILHALLRNVLGI